MGDKLTITFDEQEDIIKALKNDLQAIRDHYRSEISTADQIVKVFESREIIRSDYAPFYDHMKTISVSCSEHMGKFTGDIIRQSMSLCSDKPPCNFQAIAIGSLARGEATPYSDLEYLFLVSEQLPETLEYFEKLSMASYFLIGNLGETKLGYMAIDELEGWFEDQSKSGLKIDGLTKDAGNIPTGNGSIDKHNHFIVTPQALIMRYRQILHNPIEQEAKRGDLTAMLTYMKSIFSHGDGSCDLLQEVKTQISRIMPKKVRTQINMEMLQADIKKFVCIQTYQLHVKGFTAHIKKELYRLPSILLLDISIIFHTLGNTSWDSVEMLHKNRKMSSCAITAFQFLLAAATYMRLSAYLYHDSQDDRMSVTQHLSSTQYPQNKTNCPRRRWQVSEGLYITIFCKLYEFQGKLQVYPLTLLRLKDIHFNETGFLVRWCCLHYCGRHTDAIHELKLLYGDKLCVDPLSLLSTHNMLSFPILRLVAEVMRFAGEYKAALTLYEYMSTKYGVTDSCIVQCHLQLKNFSQAEKILDSIRGHSKEEETTLFASRGMLKANRECYSEAVSEFLQALKIQYDLESVDPEKILTYGAIQPDFMTINNLLALGEVFSCQGKHSLAISFNEKACSLASELYGEDAVVRQNAETLVSLGMSYLRAQCDYAKAEKLAWKALDIYRSMSDQKSKEQKAAAYNILACIHRARYLHSQQQLAA